MSVPASPTFPAIRLPQLDGVTLPDMARVRIRQPDLAPLEDVQGAVREGLAANPSLTSMPPGASLAIGVGSRGIANLPRVVEAAVGWAKERGLAPFIVPAMGSHGGGTAEGQVAVLARLGVTDAVGCPIQATMETVSYGHIDAGTDCRFDANAAAADGVLVINRVKAHTSFPRPVESGLTKMLAVGFGKAAGAYEVHRIGPSGFTETLPRLAARIIERAPLKAGIALVENARKEIAAVKVCGPQEFAAVDEELLEQSKSAMARLPFDQLDGLIVERLGKDVSGAGIDPAVCGRTNIRGVPDPEKPFVHKIAALGLTEAAGGNGIGVGLADLIPRHLAEALDLHSMYMNAISATIVEKAFLPIVLPDDRAVIAALVKTAWSRESGPPRICQIASSLALDEIAVTAPLLKELHANGDLLNQKALAPFAFDEGGRLLSRLGP